MYAISQDGKKEYCPHPAEREEMERILGTTEISDQMRRERTGIEHDCLCLDCLKQFRLDLDKNDKECPKCGSYKVKTIQELVYLPCPKCRTGTIQENEIAIS
jgi:DNA-directed RNA polymerase subunit RPC12/RpoP